MSGQAPIRRNDPCPCGSGRRYKECHGKLADAPAPRLDARLENAIRAHQAGRVDEAVALYREVLAADPRNPVATHYLGMAAWQGGNSAEGERLMRAALALDRSIPDFHNNLGLLLRDTGRADHAVECYRAALAVGPKWFAAYNNLGLALEDLGRFDEAVAAYREGIAGEPRFAAARQNLGRLLLALGQYEEGWRQYRWRHAARGAGPMPSEGETPFPASLAGRRIELVAEQGIGDVLFFLRFAPELVHRGARLAFRGDARLHGMLERTRLFALGARGESEPATDAEPVFVGDLPWLLAASDPGRFPQALALRPLDDRVARARTALEAAGRPPRIALTWRAGAIDPGRSQLKQVPLELLARAVRPLAGTWIAVQRNPHPGEAASLGSLLASSVHDFTAANGDLEDMLALMSLLDDYVGPSNANTHLRAGTGGGMRVLVPFPPEWRWGISGARSPWFPAMRIHRQSPGGDWSGALPL